MKKMTGIFCLLFTATVNFALAQNANNTTVSFGKTMVPAVSAQYEYSDDYAKHTLLKKLGTSGLKNPKKDNGFMVFKEVKWKEVSRRTVDIYAKVEGNNKKATVTILVALGYDNFMSFDEDPVEVDRIKQFLNLLVNDIEAYKKEQDIIAQQLAVKEAEEKLKQTEKEAAEKKLKAEKEAEKERLRKEKELQEEQKKLDQLKK